MRLPSDTDRLHFDCEALEERCLLTVLLELTAANDIVVTGDDADSELSLLVGSDTFAIMGDDAVVDLDPNFNIDEVRDLRINMGDGTDMVNIQSVDDLQFRDIRIDQRGEDQSSFTEVNLLRINLRDLRIDGGAGEFRISADELNARDIRATNRMENLSDYSRLFISDSDIRDYRWNVPGNSNSSLDFDNSTARNLRLQFGDGGASARIENATISGGLVVRGDEAQIENRHVVNIARSEVAAVDFGGGEANDILQLDSTTVTGRVRFVGGDGSDQVDLASTAVLGNATFQLGDGNDAIGDLDFSGTKSRFEQNLTMDLGDGDDAIQFGFFRGIVEVSGRFSVVGGDGDDEVNLRSDRPVSWGSFVARLGDGHDTLEATSIQVDGTTRIDAGRGDDATTFTSMVFGGGLRLRTQAGNDRVRVAFMEADDSSRIDTGSGDDQIVWIESFESTIPAMDVRLGSGDDGIFLTSINVVAPLLLDGGSGDDVLSRSYNAMVDYEQVSNFEREQYQS